MKLKNIIALFVLIFLLNFLNAGPSSLNEYKGEPRDTVRIGNQVWMSKNLSIPMPNSFWYEKDSVANKNDGRLYFSSSAFAACPAGWHLPTDGEWQEMIDYLGGDTLALKKVLAGGSSGLNLTYAGYRSANSPNDLFGNKGKTGFYWTSTVRAEQVAYARSIDTANVMIESKGYRRANAFSVRFVKD